MNRHERRAAQAKQRKGSGYLGRLLASPQPQGAPGVHHVYIQHDDWCGFFKGGDCNCDPDMHRRAEGGDTIEVINLDGSVTSGTIA